MSAINLPAGHFRCAAIHPMPRDLFEDRLNAWLAENSGATVRSIEFQLTSEMQFAALIFYTPARANAQRDGSTGGKVPVGFPIIT